METMVEQKKRAGYREVEPTAVRPGPMQSALEAAVEAAPDDLTPRMAYADWLSEQPDPLLRARGEFIQVQLALEDASLKPRQRQRLREREEELRRQNAEAWCGPFADAERKKDPLGLREVVSIHFERGWVSRFSMGRADDEEAERYARLLRDWPLARLLADLEIPRDEGIAPLVGAPFVPHLRRFTLGEPNTNGGAVAKLLARASRLEQLELYGLGLDMKDLFALALPRLRELTVHGCEMSYPLEVLAANSSLQRLEAVRFWPHRPRFGDGAYISTAAACALLRSPHLKSLKRMSIYQSDLGDEGCQALVESGLLSRLEVLDLDMGRISDAGARLLAGCPDLRRLKRLVLTQNQLTAAGIALLQATGVPLEAGGQFSADQIADQQYLEGGDYE
jgi:uncharacterized protein (TIGR02996 family)